MSVKERVASHESTPNTQRMFARVARLELKVQSFQDSLETIEKHLMTFALKTTSPLMSSSLVHSEVFETGGEGGGKAELLSQNSMKPRASPDVELASRISLAGDELGSMLARFEEHMHKVWETFVQIDLRFGDMEKMLRYGSGHDRGYGSERESERTKESDVGGEPESYFSYFLGGNTTNGHSPPDPTNIGVFTTESPRSSTESPLLPQEDTRTLTPVMEDDASIKSHGSFSVPIGRPSNLLRLASGEFEVVTI